MTDWFRSITLLAMSCVGVIVVTLGLAAVIVPGPGVASQPAGASPGASAAAGESPQAGGVEGLGGALTVTGDREGTFALTGESLDLGYALTGSDGRIVFEGQPVEIAQLSYDGLNFHPDPGDCTVTPGDVDGSVGIGFAELVCTDLADIRDAGTISIHGTVGLPIDLLVGRELPAQGGGIEVGDETWTFENAFLITWQSAASSGAGPGNYNLELVDEARATALYFTYDIQTHRIGLIDVGRDGEIVPVADGACALEREDLGKLNPRDATFELTIECAALDVPGLGPVPVSGTVIVDELGDPF